MLAWLQSHADTLFWAGTIGGGACVFLVLAAGVFFVWIPADFFRTPRRPAPKGPRWVRVVRNVLGGVILAVGVVMFFLPTPGLLVILVGLLLTDFPGKHRLLRWVLTRRLMFAAISALRRRVAKSPLIVDANPAPAPRSPARPAA